MSHDFKTLMAVIAIATIAIPACADESADTSRVYDIEEVVVVDQPKETRRLRMQPLSSTSFSSSTIKALGATDLRQLSALVPSFTMPEYGSRLTSSMYIRGIGSRVNSPAVGIYVDGIPLQNKGAFNFHTYGLERVDILHGPQGTLYGMNTEGGLVRLYTRNPFEYQGTDVKLSIGSKFWRNAEFTHYKKVNEKFAYSLGGFYDGQNGFFRNQYDNGRADKFNEFGFRGRGIWRPTDRWTFDLSADYQYVGQNAFPYGRVYTDEELAGSSIVSPLYHVKAGTQKPSQNRQSSYFRNILNTGLGMKYSGKGFDFNSMTSWQFLRDHMLMDIDYLPDDYMHMKQHQLSNSLTEELTLKSRGAGFWRWVFGAFGSYQWLHTDAPVFFDSAANTMFSNRITAATYNGITSAIDPAIVDAAGGVNINMTTSPVPGLFKTPTYNLAAFHESNIDLTKRLTATLGLRYDYSRVEIDYATSAMARIEGSVMGTSLSSTITSAISHNDDDHFNQLLPKVGLTYKLDHGSNIYAVWSKGYRSGGFNIQMFSDILQSELSQQARSIRTSGDINIAHDDAYYDRIRSTIKFKPETSYDYELGAHLNLLGSQLHVDIATFYMQIHDQQLSVMAGNYGFGRMMTNAGKSHSTGMQVTARGAALNDHLAYMLNYGFTSARFDDYKDSTSTGTAVDYKDKKVPYVPMHTFSTAADYRIDVDPAALLDPSNRFHLRSFTFGFNLSCQGPIYWNVSNTLRQKFYAVLGAHAMGDFGPMNINVWIRNLTETKYNTFAVESAATGQTLTFAQRGNPFQMGVDVSFHF